jgi:hypothetical protein
MVNDDLNVLCSLSDLKQQSEITSTVQERIKQKYLRTSSDPVDLKLFHKAVSTFSAKLSSKDSMAVENVMIY